MAPVIFLALHQPVADGQQRERRQQHARNIEPVPGTDPHIGDEENSQQDHEGTDGNVDKEDVPPVECADQEPAQGRARDRGNSGDGSPDAERRAAALRREDSRQYRQRLRQQQRRSDPLDDAETHQPAHAGREPAGCGRQRERDHAHDEHPALPEQVTEPASRDQQDREHQGVGVDHPQNAVQRRVQSGDHVGDRDVHDRQIEQRHEESERHDDQHDPGVAAILAHEIRPLLVHRHTALPPHNSRSPLGARTVRHAIAAAMTRAAAIPLAAGWTRYFALPSQQSSFRRQL